MIIKSIEQEILNSFQKLFPYLKDAIETSVNVVQKIEREFTGVGTFISFCYESAEVFGDKTLVGKRYNSIIVKSKELEHECPVDVVFGKSGLIDYIEISMGMREKEIS